MLRSKVIILPDSKKLVVGKLVIRGIWDAEIAGSSPAI